MDLIPMDGPVIETQMAKNMPLLKELSGLF